MELNCQISKILNVKNLCRVDFISKYLLKRRVVAMKKIKKTFFESKRVSFVKEIRVEYTSILA